MSTLFALAENHPENADKLDGAIGEGSSFHELHGYYAQGVGRNTAVLPADWESRLIAVKNDNTNGVTGYCLEVHDLAISKMIAMRPKDLQFVCNFRHRVAPTTAESDHPFLTRGQSIPVPVAQVGWP